MQRRAIEEIMVQRAAKILTAMAVGPREYDKRYLPRWEQGSGNRSQKVLYGDVYSGARELMHQFIGKYHMEGSHLKQC